jgi:hypothetical protein
MARFIESGHTAANHSCTNPEAYPASYRGTRRALVLRFPYGVIYWPGVMGVRRSIGFISGHQRFQRLQGQRPSRESTGVTSR